MKQPLLHALAAHIGKGLENRPIGEVRRRGPLLVVTLGGRRRPRYLVVVLSTPGPFLFASDDDPLEGVGEPVLRRLHGQRTGAPVVVPPDRTLRLPLAGEGDQVLAFHLYGSAARVRIETADTIVESLDARETGMPLPDARAKRERAPRGARASKGERKSTSTRRGTAPHGSATAAGEEAGDALAACAATGADLAAAARVAIIDRAAAPLRRHLERRSKLAEKLRRQLAEAEAFDVGRREADTLAAYQTRVPAGATEVELPDPYAEGETLRIALEAGVPLKEQIEKRYKRATKLERAREQLQARIAQVEREIATLEEVLADTGAEKFAKVVQRLDAAVEQFRLLRQRPRRARREQEGPTYRRYDLHPQWFALVGRNDRENDEITFRIAAPGDVWMHAQNVAGSHVVLRSHGASGNPPAAVLQAAASIAAHYSKARHSKLVPVIYTQRKYVRKFRGAKPGQVRCEREKTIFAEPRLP